MTNPITFILPFPPSVNTYWRHVGKRHLISENGRKFRANAIAAVYEQLRKRPMAITDDVTVIVKMYPPTNHRRDIDNYLKAPFDALTHANVWKDDEQVKRVDMQWCEVVKGGRFEIQIIPIS
ncbi:RusA family crossover junction endodeoxyribonuclease [Providencia sp. wls1922]|uniref:RusA family crossover junction endodeoxyribonuclease n=1 Tax=Providencia sp. wls1922 TaxID=2675152 RepID=UPI0012B5307C|nr:RusA family crossover junction endodeoxyribonuclease [Providencia sp. wls1922]MTC46762.1 RusA family crossover junction endodeoxyribonuclease [Providencia sp. wls1922]